MLKTSSGLLATPLPPLFPASFRPPLPSKNAPFCRARGTPQSLERGSLRRGLSPQSSGRKFLPEICVKTGPLQRGRSGTKKEHKLKLWGKLKLWVWMSSGGVGVFHLKGWGRTPKSTHHAHKIDDQHRECKTGGGAHFAFFLGSENSHTTPPKIAPDAEDLLWGWCVVGGPLWGPKKIGMSLKIQRD